VSGKGGEAEKISGRAKNYVNNHNVFLPKGKGGKGQEPFIERKKMGGISAKRVGRGRGRKNFWPGEELCQQ
jgi:hypothetical protein